MSVYVNMKKGNRIMWYVYCKHLKTNREDFINTYQNENDAIYKIASCYNIDNRIGQLGEYYYFMKKH